METNQTYSFDEAFQTALAYFGATNSQHVYG